MLWFGLSLLSAFGQAFSWALKKKTLQNKGVNNTLGVLSCLVAGLVLAVMYVVAHGVTLPPLTERFWISSGAVIGINILASWMAYRALDIAPLSFLMPFVALSALGLIPIEYIVRDVMPNIVQVAGIAVVVAGAILFSFTRQVEKVPLRAVLYFSVTVLCYSASPAFGAVAVRECGSGLLAASVYHLGISFGFVGLMVQAREGRVLRALQSSGELPRILALIVFTGIVVATLENGPNTVALGYANASEVMAVKRTMPFFALLLGIWMFKEKVTLRHVVGTALLVTGSFLVVWFKG